MNNENGPQVFMLLGRIGGDAALEQIEAGLNTNDPNMVALSVRAMSNWPNAVVWEKLLAAASNAPIRNSSALRRSARSSASSPCRTNKTGSICRTKTNWRT